jgi:subtilase family serine protease
VAGIHGLNRIPPRPNHTRVRQVSRDEVTHTWHIVNPTAEDLASPAYNAGSGNYAVAPQDLYTIYDINPVFTGGNLAATATVAVVEQSDIEYGTVNSTTGVATGGDVATFRSLFGVPGTLNMHVYHGYGSDTCNDPGIDPDSIGEDFEASLDAEWANATAPSANLIFMSCDQSPDNGIWTSMAALIDNNLSDVMSLSYGSSELNFTSSSDYTFLDDFYSQAATQGQTIVISTGDSGSDVADQDTSGTATHGINVSGLSSSPLVTAAGGTDFQDLYDAGEGGSAQSTYWGSTNSANYADALSYVPETAWNDSCASSLIATYEGYTGAGFCATGNFAKGDVVGGSGGISTHYSVPAWQTGTSSYSNSMRSQPDIAGFAANGTWGHYLLACDSNPGYNSGKDACTSASTFGGGGGTSFVAPYMAGVFGLLRTATGSRQGVVNPALYALAKAQYTASATKTACYANGQSSNTGVTTGLPAASCIFNDVTTSNNDEPCASGSTSCFVNSGKTDGMLSLDGSSSLSVAYPSAAGFDQVTGLGSIKVANLISKWNTAFTSSTSLSVSETTISPSQSVMLTATVTGGAPTGYVDTPPAVTGSVTFKAGTTVLGSSALSSGTAAFTAPGSSLKSGANSMTATFGGSGTYPSSTSSSKTVTVTAASTVTSADNATTIFSASSQALTLSATVTSGAGTVSGGTITFTVLNGSTQVGTAVTSGTVSSGSASASYILPAGTAAGTYEIEAVYNGDASFSTSSDTTHTLAVTQASQTITFAAMTAQPVLSAYTLTATASSGLAVTYKTNTPTICSISGSKASLLAVGYCTIAALQAGNGDYTAAATVSRNLQVVKTTQTITFAAMTAQPVLSSYTLTASASSGLPITYKSTTPTICTISGSKANLLAVGYCGIEATQPGNSDYTAATSVGRNLQVVKASQTITFAAMTAQPVLSTYTLTATASSGLAVTYKTSTPTICTITGSSAHLLAVGYCAITASQAGNSDFSAAASVGRNLQVVKASQTITFPAMTAQPVNTTYPLPATASSGLTVTYTTTTPTICTISGGSAILNAVGYCGIYASQAGNSDYAAAPTVGRNLQVVQ